MTFTVAELLAIKDLSLTLVAGGQGLGRPIRWAHVSELDDPTPFLRDGEVLLTTGMGLRGSGPGRQARFVEQLAAAELAALGFGLGFGFEATPPAVVEQADRAGFPVFEVPYELPFIAITEALFTRLVNEQYVLLQRAGVVQQTLSRLLLEGSGLDALLGAYARMTGTKALLLDLHGEVVAAARGATEASDPNAAWAEVQRLRPDGNEFSLTLSDGDGHRHRSMLPILVGGAPAGFLVMARAEPTEPYHHVVVHHLATAIALDLSKAQAVASTERRLVGDFLDALLEGQLSGEEVRRRLRFLGLGDARPVAVLVGRHEEALGAAGSANGGARGTDHALEALRRTVEDRLSRQPGRYVCNQHDGAIVALLEAADLAAARATAESVALGARSRGVEARFGLGAPEVDPDGLRRRYQEARFALGRAAVAGALGSVATVDDLGSHRLLLALQEDAALEAFERGLLGPIRSYDDRQHGELVQSLRVFLDHNGNWESAARALSVHRHTLRYRIRRIAELTGRNLDLAADRVEFWLALKAAEVLVGRRTAER